MQEQLLEKPLFGVLPSPHHHHRPPAAPPHTICCPRTLQPAEALMPAQACPRKGWAGHFRFPWVPFSPPYPALQQLTPLQRLEQGGGPWFGQRGEKGGAARAGLCGLRLGSAWLHEAAAEWSFLKVRHDLALVRL